MINIISILTSLTTLTSTNSTIDFESINNVNTVNSYINSRICYAFDGSSRYLLNNDLENYYLYDNLNQKNIKTWKLDNSFNDIDNKEISIYSASEDKFYTFDGKNVFELNNGLKLTNSEVKIIAENDLSAGSYAKVESLPIGVKKINNYEYFFKLKKNHSENKRNMSCSIVSFSTLLGYYDTFAHDNMISDIYDNTVVESLTYNNFNSFSQSAGVDKMGVKNNFHDYLCTTCKKVTGIDPRYQEIKNDAIFGKLYDFYRYYLSKEINVSCELAAIEGNLNDAISKANVTNIKKTIDQGRPVIAIGCGHATVAFAYDDKYIYVQGDRDYIQKTPWDTVDDYCRDGLFDTFSFGMADIKVNSLHLHNNNYYNSKTKKYVCSCGYVF